jgi:RNA polymerase II subunit A small phosphatase-like protein
VHSVFRPIPKADYVLPVEIEGVEHYVYGVKRPGCDIFLEQLGRLFEVVVFTSSLA